MTTCIALEHYGHPGSHPPSIITQDKNNRFVTDVQIAAWDGMKNHQFVVKGNPHVVTADDVGLGNVDNTADADKPISTSTQVALDAKVDQNKFTNHYHYQLRNAMGSTVAIEVDAAGDVKLLHGSAINEFSNDASMASKSQYAVPTEQAVVGYVLDQLKTVMLSYLSAPDGSPKIAFSVDNAGRVSCYHGTGIDKFSDDATMSNNSPTSVPTEKAVVGYVTNALVNFFPSSLSTPDGRNINAFVVDNAGMARFPTGVSISRFSSDATLASNSNEFVPTERAVKGYVDTSIANAHPQGISQQLRFNNTVSGDVAFMEIKNGVITAVTLVP